MIGKVHWFNNELKYGFIVNEDGDQFFVHQSQILKEKYRSLKKREVVEFEPVFNDGRFRAINVISLGKKVSA